MRPEPSILPPPTGSAYQTAQRLSQQAKHTYRTRKEKGRGGQMDVVKGPSHTSALLKLYHFIQLMAAACHKPHNFTWQLLYCPLHACHSPETQRFYFPSASHWLRLTAAEPLARACVVHACHWPIANDASGMK